MNRRDSDQQPGQRCGTACDARARRRRASRSGIALRAACLCLGWIAAVAQVRADQILAYGTEEMFWVARVIEPAPDSRRELRTVIRGRGVGVEAQWTDVAQLASRVTSLAHRGTQLAALLESGSWMLLWPNGSSVGAQPRDGARLEMLAGGTDAIWAIGRGAHSPATAPSPATTAPAVSSTQPHPDTAALALYRLDMGHWTQVTPLPADVSVGDLDRASFAVIGRTPMLAVLRFGGTVQTYAYVGAGASTLPSDGEAVTVAEPGRESWTALPPIHAPDAQRIKLLSDVERPIAWIAPELGAGRIYLGEARRWSDPRLLQAQESIPADSPRTVALAGRNIRLLFIRQGSTYEQTFGRDGAALTDARPLRTTAATPTDTMPSRIVTLAAAAMLMMVVLSSLRRGTVGAATPAAIAAQAGVVPAPVLVRFLAGLLDASPLLITCWLVFSNIDREALPIDELLAQTSLPFYTALGGYLLYTWLAETIFARTVGKALFGLRVVTPEGSRPGPGAIFVRNALRLIDVTMLGIPLLLVILSPLRQRVGDIAARTLVAGRAPSSTDDAAHDTPASPQE